MKALQFNQKRGSIIEKTATLNLRVNPAVKQRAEDILKRLGIPMATAIDMYLNQITLKEGIPFAVTLPKTPVPVNTDPMSTNEIHVKLQEGYDDIKAGKVRDAAEAFAKSILTLRIGFIHWKMR